MAEKSFSERFYNALCEMQNPVKDATADVGKYSYNYATLDVVMDVVKPILMKHGLMYRQACEKADDGSYELKTYVMDKSEERLLDVRPLIFGSDSQRNGIVETYSRRYATNTAMGLAPVDTDAVETRGSVMTTPALKSRIEKGIEACSSAGIDPTNLINDFAGWETDMTIAKNLLGALGETYKKASTVQQHFNGMKGEVE